MSTYFSGNQLLTSLVRQSPHGRSAATRPARRLIPSLWRASHPTQPRTFSWNRLRPEVRRRQTHLQVGSVLRRNETNGGLFALLLAVKKLPPNSRRITSGLERRTTMKATPALSFTLFLVTIVAFFSTTATATTPSFVMGENVATNGTTNVRSAPDGALLGTQQKGAPGIIVGGPVHVSGNSITWWRVDFVAISPSGFPAGPSGWVGADMLVEFSAPRPVPVTLGTGADQTLIVDEFGNIDVTWYGLKKPNCAFPTCQYYFTESSNQGLTWIAPTLLPMSPAQTMSPVGPSVAVESNGAIDVLYSCQNGITPACPGSFDLGLNLIRSVNHGLTWSSPVAINLWPHSAAFGAAEPVIAACGAGVTIVWADDGVGTLVGDLGPNTDIMLRYVVGGVPSIPVNLSHTPGSEGHPQMIVNHQSNVFVTWDATADNSTGGLGTVVFASVPNCGAVPNH
jgi:hypothetical protein